MTANWMTTCGGRARRLLGLPFAFAVGSSLAIRAPKAARPPQKAQQTITLYVIAKNNGVSEEFMSNTASVEGLVRGLLGAEPADLTVSKGTTAVTEDGFYGSGGSQWTAIWKDRTMSQDEANGKLPRETEYQSAGVPTFITYLHGEGDVIGTHIETRDDPDKNDISLHAVLFLLYGIRKNDVDVRHVEWTPTGITIWWRDRSRILSPGNAELMVLDKKDHITITTRFPKIVRVDCSQQRATPPKNHYGGL